MQITELNNGSHTTNDNLLASIAKTEQQPAIPAGYLPIQLSTRGKLGAPSSFHVRNFNTRDMMTLALTDEDALPEKIIDLLDELIYEDVDVKRFHENEIIETIIRLYAAFFSPVLSDIDFPIEEEDYEDLQRIYPDDSASKIEALKNGTWKPKTSIDILRDVNTYDIDDNFNPIATVSYRKTGFSVAFGLPRYGDILTVKKWLADNYGEKEKRFASVKKLAELRDQMIEKYEQGSAIDLNRLPNVDPEVEASYNSLQIEKTGALVDIIRALHLVGFDGKDVSNLSLAERAKLVQDPRVDVSVARKLDNYFETLQFGIKPEVAMLNPITNEMCVRRFSFRLADILQAIQLSETDEYDVILGNEYQPDKNRA